MDHGDAGGSVARAETGLPPLTVAIQAGGESRRMGRSKATVPFLGLPLLEHVVLRIASIADEILVTTNEPENLAFLRTLPCAGKVRLAGDVLEARSSLGGLCTAFLRAKNDLVAVGACDMMFLSPELYQAELAMLAEDPALAAAIPTTSEGLEPFHGVYRRQACLQPARLCVARGCRSIRACLAGLSVREVTSAEVAALDPGGLCFMNANTPEELARAEGISRWLTRGR